MKRQTTGSELPVAAERVLGYLNFATGPADDAFFAGLNALAFSLAPKSKKRTPETAEPLVSALAKLLRDRLATLRSSSPAFADAAQAEAVLSLVFDHVLPAYRAFHSDLLFHQDEKFLFNPFFVGRVCEAVIRQGGPWDDTQRIVRETLRALNDYIGHRPVPSLESQKTEPYPHESLRPVPYYLPGAGVSIGRYHDVFVKAIELLTTTDDDILSAAHFDPARLQELAIDPRAYDFDHPVNKRPNYHFGQWDPHQIDNAGYYRRFVVQQVTLESLTARLTDPAVELPPDERLFEAGAVLAGTILMAAGISGSGPDTFDSSTSLAKLLPRIAKYRDQFYERLYKRASGAHAERLQQEAAEKRQPFGGARQHLNAELAKRRAAQLAHVHLAHVFARMGYADAASREADVVPAASARLGCQIDCKLTIADQALSAGRLEEAAAELPQILALLKRGIECGAIVDPWNILGFDANFSLFPALENSVRDHRCDELVEVMEQIFALYSRVWSEAAARDQRALYEKVKLDFLNTAEWWHRFAVDKVSSMDAFHALDVYHAAEHVARALVLWHQGGAAAGDVAFWAPHAEMFDSPKAYALVIEALLDRNDFVASMALLIHWLGQAERMGLEKADCSFTELAERWMVQLRKTGLKGAHDQPDVCKTWSLIRKFLDYLEANAEAYGRAPQFEAGRGAASKPTADAPPLAASGSSDDDEDEPDLFGAAYEDMVYRDSTDDGVEGETVEGTDITADELTRESKRLAERLAYLSCMARLWKQAAAGVEFADMRTVDATQRSASMRHWSDLAVELSVGLARLMDAVRAHKIPRPAGDHDSMVDYDRRRVVKESLLERIIATNVESADAVRLLLSAVDAIEHLDETREETVSKLDDDQQAAIRIIGAILRRDSATVRLLWQELVGALQARPLLYVPLSKGGNPRDIVAARVRQRTMQDLLAWLPRLGLLSETCLLMETAREMERHNPVGPGAVTEFDELFKIGYKALVSSLVTSADTWDVSETDDEDEPITLITCLEQLTESLLVSWLAHSRTLRLSVLEKVSDKQAWAKLVAFVEKYGGDLFTQRFLNMGNIRAILHQSVDAWVKQLVEERPADADFKFLDDLQAGHLAHGETVEHLALVLEAVIENYAEYRDYNSTTTQSDRGELLYTLLDFLRLRMEYDRVSWNLKPVVWAHEILVRRGENKAAEAWRRALTERISAEADRYLKRLGELQRKYAMRMPTVADRLAERFIQPLAIDRIRALVEPAIAEARVRDGKHRSLKLLERETAALTRQPTGVGLDLPAWLMALEEEVEIARLPAHEKHDQTLQAIIPYAVLPPQEVKRQLEDWTKRT
jgi:hypothetical protein